MSDDWQPGDLALCIKMGSWELEEGGVSTCGPQLGKTYVVCGIERDAFFDASKEEVFLVLERFPYECWMADRFCKITPGEADEFDREAIRLLTGKPAKAPA